MRATTWLSLCYHLKPPCGSYSYSWTDQCSKVDGSVQSEWLYEWWPTPSLNVAVIQRQAAEVAVQLQCHRVPAAIIDTTAGDAQHVGTVTNSTTTIAKVTGQLEPQLPLLQLLTHIYAQLQL